MAAAGLQPGQEEDRARHEHNVLTLVEFATALMAALDAINRESFQNFKLRTGQKRRRSARLIDTPVFFPSSVFTGLYKGSCK